MKAMTTTMKRLHFTPTAKISVAAGVAGVLVLVQFVLLILGAYVSRSEADQAVASAFESVGDATEQRVDAFVLSIKDAADRLTTALENPDVTPELAQDLVTVEFTRTWSASSIAVTYADGSFFRVTDAADAQLEGVYVQASMEPWIEPVVVDQYVLTPAGQNSGQAATTLATDPREASSFVAAQAINGVVWPRPAQEPLASQITASVAQAVRGAQGELLAVVVVSVDSEALREDLSMSIGGVEGSVVILTEDREVVAQALLGTPRSVAPVGDFAGALQVRKPGETAEPTGPADLPLPPRTNATAGPQDQSTIFGEDDGTYTMESGLRHVGAPWVMHVRVDNLGVASTLSTLSSIAVWVTVTVGVLSIALGIALWQLWKPARHLSENSQRDPLTGLFNRRHVDARATAVRERATASGRVVAVVMFDLDEFKTLNDTLGHHAGDKALALVSETLTESIRARDVAIRWGGDEFLLLVTLEPDDDARMVIDRIRADAHRALTAAFPGVPGLGVTGGYLVTENVNAPLGALVASADEALIVGKATARGALYGSSAQEAQKPAL